MPKKQELKVVKIPIKGSILSKPQVFPRMPRLYLELIENKQKIKQDLINKEYNPDNLPDNLPDNYDSSEREKIAVSPPISHDASSSNKKFEDRLDMLLKDDDSSIISNNTTEVSSNKSPDNSISKDSDISTISTVSELSINEEKSDVESKSSDNLSERLKELLKEDSDSEVKPNKKPNKKPDVNKYSRHRDKEGHSIPHRGISQPPTLAELEANGGYVPKRELRDINQTNPENEQQEEDAKRELLFKFDLLRKSYPVSTIPEYNIHTDLTLLEKSYSDCVRRLSLDSTVENYKTYLVYGFMGCEFVFGNFLGFDMQGFTQQQIISMHSYEKLLIELGEKSYVPKGSSWPVELRLLFMIIMNAAFFVVSKMMMKKTGANLMGMLNSISTPKAPSIQSNPKRKMKGPNIDLGDIPEL
jgi:hypothetical protein